MADIIAFQLPLDGLSSYSQKTTWLLDQSLVSPSQTTSGRMFGFSSAEQGWLTEQRMPLVVKGPLLNLKFGAWSSTYMTIVLFVSLQWPLCFTNLVCKFVKTNHYPNTQVLPERYEEMKHRDFFRIFQVIKNKKLS